MSDTNKNPLALALVAVHGLLTGCGSSQPTTSGGTPVDVTLDTQPTRAEYPPAPSASSSGPAAPQTQLGKAKSCCKGSNECKGLGECKTDANGCKGKNECKGLGGCAASDCKADPGGTPGGGKACCKGLNECKGQGQCKTEQHDCKGLNQCKAKGGCAPSSC